MITKLVRPRGDSGPMSHFSDYSPLQVTLIAAYIKKSTRILVIEPLCILYIDIKVGKDEEKKKPLLYRLITGMNLIGCLHCVFWYTLL